MTERITTRTTILWLDDEGFARMETRDDAQVTIEDAREVIRASETLIQGKQRPVLSDITKLRSISREARSITSRTAVERYTAAAIVVGSPISRAIGNFFIGLHKPAIPTRLFSSVEEGLAWLREQSRGGAQSGGGSRSR